MDVLVGRHRFVLITGDACHTMSRGRKPVRATPVLLEMPAKKSVLWELGICLAVVMDNVINGLLMVPSGVTATMHGSAMRVILQLVISRVTTVAASHPTSASVCQVFLDVSATNLRSVRQHSESGVWLIRLGRMDSVIQHATTLIAVTQIVRTKKAQKVTARVRATDWRLSPVIRHVAFQLAKKRPATTYASRNMPGASQICAVMDGAIWSARLKNVIGTGATVV